MNKPFENQKGKLQVVSPAKINLHLEVLGIRPDGFHELAMVMQSIDLVDSLDFKSRSDSKIVITSNNPTLSMGNDNLIMKAAKLIRSRSGLLNCGVSIHLTKNIPIGAGLAGGSSNAAATLRGLNSLWKIGYSNKDLERMSADLGSDVPFCLSGGLQLCFGRGECLEPLKDSSKNLAIVLVKDPSKEVSTPWAYGRYKQINYSQYLTNEVDFEVRRQVLRDSSWLNPINELKPPPLRNDLQDVVAPVTPAVKNALRFLSELKGTLSIAMSGSGPSCFAVFSDYESARSSLELNRNNLDEYGLEAWCCSFKPKEFF